MPTKINGYTAGTTATDPLGGVKGRSVNPPVTENAPAGGAAQSQGGGATTDHVTLTDSAVQLQKLSAAVASAPVVNSGKVTQVKKAVDSGTYTVNTARVADKILGFETGLAGK